ncbi:SDR family oxidoreductase [Streptomyces sp. NPDC049881]|uniref:SDR family oxidoreductase n=1 Tax=unclassified Streptomyces TaxID=2593676 RepID=UPI003420AA0A
MIVVTGSTGQFGRLVVEHLLKAGVPAGRVAAGVRTPAKAAGLASLGVEVRVVDYDRAETLTAAFADAEKVLLVSSTGPDEARVAQHRAVVGAARASGVALLGYTSVTGAPTSPLGLAEVHRATERAIEESGVPAVLLRNGWYTENYSAVLPGAVARGELVGSAGDGRIASASRSDLAEAAAVVLTREGQAGAVHDLTGDTAWTMAELAAEAAAQSGRPVAYTDLPADEYRRVLDRAGLPGPAVELIVDADVQIARGALSRTTGDLSALLGRPTTPLAVTVGQALGG